MISFFRGNSQARIRIVWPTNPGQVLFRRRPRTLPPFLLRQLAGAQLLVYTLSAMTILLCAGFMLRGLGLLGDGLLAKQIFIGQLWLLFPPIFLVILITVAVMRGKVRRVYVVARSMDYRMCTHCGYALRGLAADTHSCPECGAPYNIEKTRAAWQALAGQDTSREEERRAEVDS